MERAKIGEMADAAVRAMRSRIKIGGSQKMAITERLVIIDRYESTAQMKVREGEMMMTEEP